MTPIRHVCLVSALILGVSSGAAPAFAQGPGSSRPFGRLFGGSTSVGDSTGHNLDFTASVVEAYDNDTSPELQIIVDPSSPQSGGFFTMLQTNANYNWTGTRAQLAANTGSAMGYYGELREVRSISHTASVGLLVRLSGHTSLTLTQTGSYSPSYLYGLFPRQETSNPGEAVPTAPDYAITPRESYSYTTALTIRHTLTRRMSLLVAGDYQYTDFLQQTDAQRDMKVNGARTQFSRNLKRNTALTVGYRYRAGDVGYVTQSATEHGMDIGLSSSRPLSATRRALVGFRLGASTMELPEVPTNPLAVTGRRYFVNAEGTLGYQFGRTWDARTTYRRGLEYVAALTQPVFTNGFSVGVDGAFNRRLDLQASAAYSSGASALSPDSSRFDTYAGDVRLRYGITSNLAGYVQYLYYFYDFRGNTQLAPGLPSVLERNAVRAGFMVWLPALQR